MIGATAQNDGYGRGRWIALAACSMGFLVANIHRISPGVYASELMREFNTSASVLGLLSSSYFYTYGLLQIPVGFMCDRFRPGRVMGLSMLASVLGSIWFAMSRGLIEAMLARILLTAGISSVFIAAVRIFGYAFAKGGFSMATGVMVAAGSVGGIAALAPLAVYIESFGWRSSMLATAGLTLAVAVLILLATDKYKPGTMGKSEEGRGARFSLQEGRKEYMLMLYGLGFAIMLQYGTQMGYQGLWGVPFLMDIYGFTKIAAGNILTYASIGAVAGSALVGWLVDSRKASPHSLMLWSASLVLVSWFPMCLKLETNVQLMLSSAALLLGGASSFTAILNPTFGNSFIDDSSRGRFFGILNSCSMVGASIFQPLMGIMIDSSIKTEAGIQAGYFASFRLAFACSLMVLLTRLAMYYRYRRLTI